MVGELAADLAPARARGVAGAPGGVVGGPGGGGRGQAALGLSDQLGGVVTEQQ